jgi:ATP adenylyltransferase
MRLGKINPVFSIRFNSLPANPESLLKSSVMGHHLWSPWRMKYIENHEKKAGCVFCTALEQEDGPGNLIVFRGEHAFVILNRFPYTTGHLLVVPYAHHPSLGPLEAAVRAEMMELVNHTTQVLEKAYQPDGFNIGVNIGAAAGAGVADHVHMHVVPRWVGDANFMSTLGETRVLPELLEDTYRRMVAAW